ncbi:hypothetical protein [Actinoalloteichus spitiensis]|uniref:hypothetical protein n=1 Tax=Actinoalloteichus spitiensis TaxID=252394 RepID=UPI0003669F58|nr:hypothetical protein [Actinoalloteichus spitiensis]
MPARSPSPANDTAAHGTTFEEPTRPATREAGRGPAPRAAVTALLALAALPVLFTLVEVFRAPPMHYGDYWTILSKVIDDTGALAPAGLFELYNQHPIVVTGLLFYVDAVLFGGSNHLVGVVNVVASSAMVAALWTMLPRRLSPPLRAALVATFSLLLFSPAILEFYAMSMSGAHWLAGFAPAVVALAAAHRGRTVAAVLLALLGSLGHGAAFPVWLAIALVAWLRRDAAWRIWTPLVLLGGVVVAFLTMPGGSSVPPADAPAVDVYLMLISATMGQIFAIQSVDLATLAGLAALLGVAVSVTAVVRARLAPPPDPSGDGLTSAASGRGPAESAGWVGLALHATLVAAMVGSSRVSLGVDIGQSARYAIIPALTWIALVTLFVLLRPRVPVARAVAVTTALGVVAFVAGSTQGQKVRNELRAVPLLAVAAQVGAHETLAGLKMNPDDVPAFAATGAYPFHDGFTLGCGGPELGDRVDLASVRELAHPDDDTETAGYLETGRVEGDAEISGWALVEGARADCVLVVDTSGTVIGGGMTGLNRPDLVDNLPTSEPGAGFQAVAAAGLLEGRVLVARDGALYEVVAGAEADVDGAGAGGTPGG